MAHPPHTPEQLQAALDAVQTHGGVAAAARALGMPRQTLDTQYQKAKAAEANGSLGRMVEKSAMVEMPDFVTGGDEEEPIESIIARQMKAFERKHKAANARKWFPVTVKEEKPYGVLWFGDPHIDNGGCNWPLLDRHLAVARQPGIYGGNIGDTTDNWPWTGRLAKLWADSEVSSKTAKRMAEWLMFDAGVKWIVWLIGNHDAWNGGDEFYKKMGASHVPVLDWRAQFRLIHNNGSSTKIDAAHGRKGNSIYNPSHGTLRDAKFGEEADLFVTGHIHSFKLDHFEIAERSKTTWLAQCRGYKFHDHYAWVNGFAEYQNGASILTVIDPETGRIPICFADPEEGAEYLKWRRR